MESKALPRRVESARNALVSYIHDHRLEAGDRLPAYARLREAFGFGSETIAAAVDSLCDAGVLEVRDKVGLFVLDPEGGHLIGRTVAMAIRNLSGSAYAATLAGFLQNLLAERNCRCLAFYQSSSPEKTPEPGLDDFPGLKQAVQERRCDGVLTLCPLSPEAQTFLKECDVQCCFIGDDDVPCEIPLAVVIDVRRFLHDAASSLRDAGCRHLAQLCASSAQLASRRGDFGEALVGGSYDGGAAIARQLLQRPPAQRPDGIVSDDDTIVSGFLAELISAQLPQIGYLPKIATIVHQELGERYPAVELMLFSQQIEVYAEMAVDLLLGAIRGGVSGPQRFVYRFQPVFQKKQKGVSK